jgi:hypothetical protein
MANTNTCIPKEIANKLKQQFKAKKPLSENDLRQKISDLVYEKYGVNLDANDAKQITDLSSVLKTAKDKLGDNIGSIDHEKEMIDYFTAENKMNEYLKSLDPSSNMSVATGTIGRGVMLTSIKSPIINIGSNIENTIVESLTRRISSGQFTKANSELASSYMKMANNIYDKTGVDISRMMDVGDVGIGGQRILGKDTISAVGSGPIRKTGQWFEDKIFKQLMGKPDSLTANYNFTDSTLLNATKLAKNDARLAKEYAKDAMLLNPKTQAGKTIRAQAVLDAQVATYTQRTWMSSTSERIRDFLNKSTGDLRLGDWFMPFVKTPANVISTSADYAGLGAFKALYEFSTGIKNGTLKDPTKIRAITTNLTRAGMGLTAAWGLSQLFDKSDFVGAYDPKRSQIEQLKNSNYNAVRIGDKWVSMDWFGPLSIPLTAMMYAKKGEGYQDKMRQYAIGITDAVFELPGLDVISAGYKNAKFAKSDTAAEIGTDAAKGSIDQISSRLIPGILTDIGKMIDPNVRDTSNGIIDTTKSKLPFLRQSLPVKTNILGEQMKAENPIMTLLFGSRVKTDNNSDVVKELDRVTSANDKGSSFTDFKKTSSKTVAQFKEKVGPENFKTATNEYGALLKGELDKLFKSPKYQKLSDADKMILINQQDDQARETIFRKYSFRYKQDKKKPLPNL